MGGAREGDPTSFFRMACVLYPTVCSSALRGPWREWGTAFSLKLLGAAQLAEMAILLPVLCGEGLTTITKIPVFVGGGCGDVCYFRNANQLVAGTWKGAGSLG